MNKLAAAIVALSAFAFIAYGIDWSLDDCISRAARTAPTDSGFRALVYMCQDKFQAKPKLTPFDGKLDQK